ALVGAAGGPTSRRLRARGVRVRTVAPPTSTPAVAVKEPLEALIPPLPRWFRSGPATQAKVALSVDDLFRPADADSLALLLEVGKAANVRFSLFPTGGALQTHLDAGKQDVWRRAVDEGHEIRNHTYTHRPLPSLTDAEIRSEITRTEAVLATVLGSGSSYRMRLLRPPGGAGGFVNGGDARIVNVVTSMGYSMAMWSIDSNGTAGNQSFVAKVVKNATNGSIVLAHFTTLAEPNFPALIDRLRNERHLDST